MAYGRVVGVFACAELPKVVTGLQHLLLELAADSVPNEGHHGSTATAERQDLSPVVRDT